MCAVIKNEFKMMFSNTRLNRLRYIAYSGFLFISLVIISTLATLAAKFIMSANNLPIKLFALAMVIVFIVLKYWFVKRRVNDTGRSFWSYLAIIVVAMILIFLPTTMTAALSALGYSVKPLGAIGKLTTALTYLAGIGAVIYAGCMVIFFRGTAGENKYGVTPPANNYFTISLSVLYVSMLVAMNAVGVIQTKKAISNLMKQKQTESMAVAQMTDLNMPVMKSTEFSASGIPSDLDVVVK